MIIIVYFFSLGCDLLARCQEVSHRSLIGSSRPVRSCQVPTSHSRHIFASSCSRSCRWIPVSLSQSTSRLQPLMSSIFSVFKKVEAQIKKTDSEHPFSEILAQDLTLPQEKVHAQADVFVEHATCIANKLKKLVFVESPLESIKFGLVLWSLTYIASWFSGFTLAILGLLGVFSVPKVYESNQEAIDPHLATISGHLKNVQNM